MDTNDRIDQEMDGGVRGGATRVTSSANDERLADAGRGDASPDAGNPGDEIGEAVGGISGVLTGAALGSLGGPVGTIIGGIAGAVSGWWAGRAISDAASHASDEDETYYRSQYSTAYAAPTAGGALGTATGASSGMSGEPGAELTRPSDGRAARSYDDVRPAYQIGHLAGRNPDYQGRSFEEVEADLRRGWTPEVSARHGEWDEVRAYARSAFERSRGMGGASAAR